MSPQLFDDLAVDDDAVRPRYPVTLADRLAAELPTDRTLRVLAAAGTGIVLDSLMPALGTRHDYVAIDSSPGQAEIGRRAFPEVHWRVDQVETVLERLYAELDLVAVGPAFHRLERDRFLRATRGALRPGGLLAVLQHEGAADVREEIGAVFGADAVEEVAEPGAARMTLARRG